MSNQQWKTAYVVILFCESAEQRQEVLDILRTGLPQLAASMLAVDLASKKSAKPLLLACMSKDEVDKALALIRERFPNSHFQLVNPESASAGNNGSTHKRSGLSESDWTWVIDILMSILFFVFFIALIFSRAK